MVKIIHSKDDTIKLLNRKLEDGLFLTSKVFQQTLLQKMEDMRVQSEDLRRKVEQNSHENLRPYLTDLIKGLDNTINMTASQPFSKLG